MPGTGGAAGKPGIPVPPGLSLLAGGLGGPGNIDGVGAAARFKAPFAVASDAGNFYVTDRGAHVIRKIVAATGAVTTFAGAVDQSGDLDGTGTSARFSVPSGITSDGAGNLYVADAGNRAIRKVVIATGTVTTLAVAGASFRGTELVTHDGAGNLYVQDVGMSDVASHIWIKKVVVASGTVTTLTDWLTPNRSNTPSTMAIDGAGNLYLADGAAIRRIVIATGAVTTLAGDLEVGGNQDGTGTAAQFSGPSGVASDGAGNLYITDTYNHTIRKVVLATGAVTTFAGSADPGNADGIGAAARFGSPSGIVSDGAGNLGVIDQSGTIRKVDIATGTVTTLAGVGSQVGSADGTGAAARFYLPMGIASDGAGNLFVADVENRAIRKVVVATGVVTTLAGKEGQYGSADGIGAAASFMYPSSIAYDGMGSLYVGDATTRRVAIATGAVTSPYGNELSDGLILAGDGTGNLYVAPHNAAVMKVALGTGERTLLAGQADQPGTVDGTSYAARFASLSGAAIDGDSLYVADAGSATIRKIVIAAGTVTTFAGMANQSGSADGEGTAARFTALRGVAGDGAGTLYVADGHTIRKIVIATATVSTVVGSAGSVGVSPGPLPASLNAPGGVVFLPGNALAILDENAVLLAHL